MNHDVILYSVIAALTALSIGLGAWLFIKLLGQRFIDNE
jgi:hypothetical protein